MWKFTLCTVHVIIVGLTHENILWESMGKPCSCAQFRKSYIMAYRNFFYYKSHENLHQYCKSCKNPYLVLQVSALHASEHAMKSMVGMIKSSSPQYQAILEKTPLVRCHWHCYSCCTLVQYRRQNTRDIFCFRNFELPIFPQFSVYVCMVEVRLGMANSVPLRSQHCRHLWLVERQQKVNILLTTHLLCKDFHFQQ